MRKSLRVAWYKAGNVSSLFRKRKKKHKKNKKQQQQQHPEQCIVYAYVNPQPMFSPVFGYCAPFRTYHEYLPWLRLRFCVYHVATVRLPYLTQLLRSFSSHLHLLPLTFALSIFLLTVGGQLTTHSSQLSLNCSSSPTAFALLLSLFTLSQQNFALPDILATCFSLSS